MTTNQIPENMLSQIYSQILKDIHDHCKDAS